METNERLRLSAHNEGLSAAKAPRYHDNFLLRLGPSLIVRLLTIVCAANRINRGACCRRQEKREHNRCRAVCGLLCWTQVYRARRVWEFTSEAQQSQDRIIYWQSFDQLVAVGVELSHKHIEFQWHAGSPSPRCSMSDAASSGASTYIPEPAQRRTCNGEACCADRGREK